MSDELRVAADRPVRSLRCKKQIIVLDDNRTSLLHWKSVNIARVIKRGMLPI